MVNIKTTVGAATGAGNQDHSLAQLIQRGNLLPVISGEVLEDLVLGGHASLVGSYSEHVGYPLGDRGELHRMVKYRSLETGWKDQKVKQDYLDLVGNCCLCVSSQPGCPGRPTRGGRV